MSDELKKIWVFAFGSRGDIQPYVAIASALVKKGYDVTFFCNGPSFAAFAESFGCKAVSLGDADADSFMRNNELMRKGMMNGDLLTFYKGMNQELEAALPGYCEVFAKAIQTQGRPELSIIMPLTNYYGWYLAIRHKVPFLPALTVASVYNPEHPPLGMPKLPFNLTYYLLYHVMGGAVFAGAHAYDKYLQANVMDTYGRANFIAHIKQSPIPVLVLTSPEIALVQAGSPERLPPSIYRVVGTTVISEELQLEHIDRFGGQVEFDRLNAFIESGEKPPIYLGWGSMICRSEEFMVKFCARAVYHSGHRAVILGGFAGLSMELLESTDIEPEILEYSKVNILFVHHAPHEWLFPRVSVIVHHGGAGTTAAALRAGVPTIITPVFADQWDFSYFLRKSGVGIGFDKQFQKIESSELGDAIRIAASDTEMRKQARLLGEKLRTEQGVSQAIAELERFWEEICVTGAFHHLFPGEQAENILTDSIWVRSALAVAGIAILTLAVGSMRSKSS